MFNLILNWGCLRRQRAENGVCQTFKLSICCCSSPFAAAAVHSLLQQQMDDLNAALLLQQQGCCSSGKQQVACIMEMELLLFTYLKCVGSEFLNLSSRKCLKKQAPVHSGVRTPHAAIGWGVRTPRAAQRVGVMSFRFEDFWVFQKRLRKEKT